MYFYHDKIISVWDFYTGKIIDKIKHEFIELKGITIYKESILIGIEGNLIKFFDLENHKIIKTLNYHKDKICSIEKKIFAKFWKLYNF